MKRVENILQRRAELIARAALQRARLADQLEIFQGPIALAQRAHASVLWVRSNPFWLLAAVATVVALSPGKTFRIARRAFVLWRDWRWAVAYFRKGAGAS